MKELWPVERTHGGAEESCEDRGMLCADPHPIALAPLREREALVMEQWN